MFRSVSKGLDRRTAESGTVQVSQQLGRLMLYLSLGLAPAVAQDSQPPGRRAASSPVSQPASQPARRSMLFNGDFETPGESGKLPAGWTTKHPDNVRLVDLGGWHGRAVEMAGKRKLMASYGVDLTSEKIPVEANTRYRCSGYTKSDGPHMKVFVKGYATATRRVKGELKTFDEIVYQVRKDIEPSEEWQSFNLDFEILPAKVFSDFQHKVKYVRVRLWAFWPVGTCWFDEISFEAAEPVPEGERRHQEAVTHVGLPPRLGEAAQESESSGQVEFDEGQTWRDAVNAFRAGDHRKAARLAGPLIAHAPKKGAYRVLAARALAELERWEEAERHARWLLEEVKQAPESKTPARQIEAWQRDWARVVRAKVCLHTGRVDEARAILKRLVDSDASPHARAAAERLLDRINDAKTKD